VGGQRSRAGDWISSCSPHFPSSSLHILGDARPELPWGKVEGHLTSLIFPPPPEATGNIQGLAHRCVGDIPLPQVALSLDQNEKKVRVQEGN